MYRIALILITFFLSGCGYRCGVGYLEKGKTISIPYVEGDRKGYLTSALVQEIATRTPWKYTFSGGDLCLQVALIDWDSENIGYRFAPKKETAGTSVIVAQEGRVTLGASVTLVNRRTTEVLVGPLTVYESLAFDFEPDFSDVNFHEFALGQLEMHPTAQEAAVDSLDRLLAKKIVDSLLYCW